MNVNRIFFEKSKGYPSFELENGDVKEPYFAGQSVKWFTSKEYEEYTKKIAEENKKSFFQKLFN